MTTTKRLFTTRDGADVSIEVSPSPDGPYSKQLILRRGTTIKIHVRFVPDDMVTELIATLKMLAYNRFYV